MKQFLFLALILFLTACNNNHETVSSKKYNIDTITTPKGLAEKNVDTAKAALPTSVAANRLIIPAKSIGLTTINEKAESVFKKLGKPDEGDAAMGKSIETWYSKSGTTKYSTTIYFTTNMGGPDEASRAKQVRITSPFFMTANRIGVNSNADSVLYYFPQAKKTATYNDTEKKLVTIYDDILSGIAFEIDSHNKCVGITIHAANEKAFETYLAFFDGIKFL